ncbi:hypothetical protein BDR06DRAFT_694261 [Suillus hirtellus]|nr:hypothetical protein BDR06DRAFT_694261 [Suillus hirtellus]
MLIRLVPSVSHGTVLYNVSFPINFPNLPTPPAWSNQLHHLTSVLRLEPPQNIHVFDRSVGLVARITEVMFDLPTKEVIVNFVDGRIEKLPMNSHCMQMLQGVLDDVKTCTEQESRRDSFEYATSTSVCSNAVSSQDIPSAPPKSPKLSRHKKQRSLLFSLISSLVPRSLSPPPAPPPSPTTPYPSSPSPLPPIPPITPRNTSFSPIPQSPVSPCNSAFPPSTDPPILRRRARATLIDVWRRHVVCALSAHNHYAGYTEWVLRGMATSTRTELREIEKSWQSGRGATRRHGRTQSEGRLALDFGERVSEETQGQWRVPSPFLDEVEGDNDDCVVYPRHPQAHECGAIRHVRNPSTCDELEAYAFEFSVENGSLLRESFGFGTDVFGDVWDDDDHVAFDNVGALRLGAEFTFDNGQLNFDEDFGSDYESGDYYADMTFAAMPSDATEEDESDESQTSLRTPEDGEMLPLPLPATSPRSSENGSCFQQRSHFDVVPTVVSKTTSSRPKTRPLRPSSGDPSAAPHVCAKPTTAAPWNCRSATHPQQLSTHFPSSPSRLPKRMSIPNAEELISTRVALLSRIRSALTYVRTRAREEHWGLLWSQNSFGCGLMDPESEGQLEIRARRRAWSAGIKVTAASAPTLFSVAVQGSSPGTRVWDGSVPSAVHIPYRPPGLIPPVTKVNGPIIPTGLVLGRPLRRSPLAMYVWSVDDVAKKDTGRHSKYGDIDLKRGGETAASRRPLRVSFLESPTKLLPVREEGDDEEGRTSKIDFPQSPTSPTLPTSPEVNSGVTPDERYGINQGDVSVTDDPFFCSPFHARARTTSMYPCSQSSQELPMLRPRTPPPSYQAAIGEDNTDDDDDNDDEFDNGTLDACALLFQPLSTLCLTSPTKTTPTRPPLVTAPPFTPRVRAVSLPTCPRRPRSPSLSSRSTDEDYQDLSQAYVAPPPTTPITAAPTIAVTESYLTYAHLHAPVPISGKASVTKGMCEKGKGIASQEVVFERNGEEYTLGLEVALGRAEEGRSVW